MSQEGQRDNTQVPDGSWVMSWFLTSQLLLLTVKITMQAAATRNTLSPLWLYTAGPSQVETKVSHSCRWAGKAPTAKLRLALNF